MDQISHRLAGQRSRFAKRPLHILPMLVAMIAVGSLSMNVLVPALPSMAKSLQISASAAQLTTSLFLATYAISQIFIGSFADRYGRRRVILFGLPLSFLATAACIFLPYIEMIVTARVLEAAGASIGMVVARAAVRDLYDREQAASAFGWVTTAMVAAPMMAPLVGGALDVTFGWRTIFIATAACYFVLLVVVWWFLPETGIDQSDEGVGKTISDAMFLLRDRNFLGYALTAALVSNSFFMLVGGAPFIVVERMHLTPVDYGLWFIMPSLGFLFGNMTAARISSRMGLQRMIVAGSVIMVLAALGGVTFVILTPQAGPLLLFGPAIIISFGNGLIIPNALAGAVSVRPQAAGAAAGFAGFVHYGSSACSLQLMSFLSTGPHGLLLLSLGILVIILVGTAAYFLLVRERSAV